MVDTKIVVVAHRAVLPGLADLTPATLEVSLINGRIAQIHLGTRTRADYPDVEDESFLELQENQVLLPGLVDCVSLSQLLQTCQDMYR